MNRWLRVAILLVLASRIAHADARQPDCASLSGVPKAVSAKDLLAGLQQVESFLTGKKPSEVSDCAEVVPALRHLADALFLVGEYGRVRKACTLLEGVHPLHGEDLARCGRPFAALGEINEARKRLMAYVSEAGTDPVARIRACGVAAGIFENASRFSVASEFLAMAVATAPRDPDLAKRFVRMLVLGGRIPDAVRESETAFGRLAPAERAPFLREVCLLLLRHGDAGPARRLASLLSNTEGIGLADLDVVLAVAGATSDMEGASKAVDRFLTDRGRRAEAIREAASALERNGLSALAGRILGQGVSDGFLTESKDLLDLGRVEARSGRIAEASQAFDRFLMGGGNVISVADEWLAARQPARAAEVLQRAVDRGPVTPELVLSLGRALHEGNDEEAEFAAYRNAIPRAEDPAAIWLEVGKGMLLRPAADRAKEAYRRAQESAKHPRQVGLAFVGLARATLAADRSARAEAERALVSAIEAAGDDAEVLAAVEAASRSIGTSGVLAIAVLQRAASREPGNAELWLKLARACTEARRRTEAVAAWEKHIETAPDRNQAIGRAVNGLLRAHFTTEGLDLLRRLGGADIDVDLAETIGNACLETGETRCAATYVERFLQGPVRMDHDYKSLGDALASARLWNLAARAYDAAKRTTPKDRHWDIDLSLGRLALKRGSPAEASAHFAKALEVAPQKRPLMLRIASELADGGRLDEASAWYGRAFSESDPVSRLQVFPAYADVLRRSGRVEDLKAAARQLGDPEKKNVVALRTAVGQLVQAGLLEDAARILKSLFESTAGADKIQAASQYVGLLVRMGKAEEAASVTRLLCTRGQSHDDAACLEAANRLDRGARPDLATVALEARAGRPGPQPVLLIRLAILYLRQGDREKALRVGRAAADAVSSPSELITDLGPMYFRQGLADDYLVLLHRLAGRQTFSADASLLLELGKAHLATGNIGGAMLAFDAYVGATRGGEARILRELLAADRRDEALRILSGASPAALAAFSFEDLKDVSEDLIRHGHATMAHEFLNWYRLGNESIPPANEILGRVYEGLGQDVEALAAFEKVRERSLSAEGRLAFVRALWRQGKTDRARAVALNGIARSGPRPGADPDEATLAAEEAILDFFQSENAVVEALAALDRIDTRGGLKPSMRLVQASLLLRRGTVEGFRAGVQSFAMAVKSLDWPESDAIDVVKRAVWLGAASELLAALRDAGRTGIALAALTACLTGKRAEQTESIRRLTEGGDPEGLALAAKAEFECGHWSDAAEYAEKALKGDPAGPDATRNATMLVTAAAAAGKDRIRHAEDLLRTGTDDRVRLARSFAAVRLAGGDLAGHARARAEVAAIEPLDVEAGLLAVQAALWAGDETLRDQAEKRILSLAEDRTWAAGRLVSEYQRALREDLAYRLVQSQLDANRGDLSLAWQAVELAIGSGAETLARQAAAAFEAISPDRRAASARVVREAAMRLMPGLVQERLAVVLQGPRSSEASEAALQAGLLFFKMGRMPEALNTLKAAVDLAVDREGLVSAVLQAGVVEPAVPARESLAIADGSGLPKDRVASMPYAILARCLKDDGTPAAECLQVFRETRFTPARILLAAGQSLLLRKRYDAARALFDAAVACGSGQWVVSYAASRVSSCLGSDPQADPSVSKTLGSWALTQLDAGGGRSDFDLMPLRASLVELSGRPDEALKEYAAGIAAAPADATLRNNLAYLLSIRGRDVRRALREVAIAEALSPKGLPFYIETEAWARFQDGDVRKAIERQEIARRLWNLDQGGGLGESFYHYGRMLEAAGRTREAVEAYRRGAVLDPMAWTGREALARWRTQGNTH